jgi:tetratricopeptide (TPR) repeat protein
MYIYNSALEAMNNKKVKKAKEAVKKLESLGNWGDAPTQLEKAKQNLKKRKHRRAIRRIITWVLILSIIGGIVSLIAYQDYQDKKSRYERAVSFMEVEDYQNAYNYFLKAENYEDAPEQAEEAKRLMNDMGKKLIKQANELTDMGLYMTAGAYLEQSMSNNTNAISSEDQDQIIEMINNNFMTGEERFVAWEESVDHEIDTAILEEYEMMAEALIAAGDFEYLFTSMVDTGIADTAFAHEFVYEAVKSGMLEYLSLDQLKNIIPESLMPMVDMAVANSGMVVEIFENN